MTNINQTAYGDIKSGDKIYASLDKDEKNGDITANEVEKDNNSVFTDIEEALIENYTKENISKSTLYKYFGKDLATIIKNSFATIKYDVYTLQDNQRAETAQASMDKQMQDLVEDQLKELKTNIMTKYGDALAKAAQNAKAEMGLSESDSSSSSSAPEEYTDGAEGVATFESAYSNKDESKWTQGYKNTHNYLMNTMHAKTRQREVNGKVQTIYIYNEGGEKKRATIDDTGKLHYLESVTTLGKNTYITKEAKEAAEQSVDTYEDNPQKIKIKRRKVDGQYQNVIMYKDDEGKKQARVIDHDDVSGHVNVSTELEHVSSGGRAKYSDSSSGLGSNLDYEYTNDGRVKHDGHTVRTQRGRNKADKEGINKAIESIIDEVEHFTNTKVAPPQVDESNTDHKIYKVVINGHEYTLDNDPQKHKETDITIRNMWTELFSARRYTPHARDVKAQLDIKEDNRVSANEIEQDEASVQGNTGIKWGVDKNHQSNDTQNIHSLKNHFNNKYLTPQQFKKEGWKASSDRTREEGYIALMDSENIRGNGPSVRNLETAEDFARRFLRARGYDDTKCNVELLWHAIANENPSIFDSKGKMYKDVDFARLNLPEDLTRYTS